MALLIDTGLSDWMSNAEIAETILRLSPSADVRTPETLGNPDEISMIAVVGLTDNHLHQFPNLKLVQKLGAGVETIVGNPNLPPHIRVARLKPDAPAREIAEWFLA